MSFVISKMEDRNANQVLSGGWWHWEQGECKDWVKEIEGSRNIMF
jgi:uncharacterized membrane protein